MKNNSKEPLSLKEDMKMNNLIPAEDIVVDNDRHTFWVTKNGQLKEASYIATQNPVGKSGPSLICSYSFIDEVKQFTYSSSE